VDGEKLSELEIATFFVLLMSAGNDSTRATYSATMLGYSVTRKLASTAARETRADRRRWEEGLRWLPRLRVHGARCHQGC